MASNTGTNSEKIGCITLIGAVASILTILGFFGITHFSWFNANASSSPDQTLSSFCSDLRSGNVEAANEQLTSQYLDEIRGGPPLADRYIGCTYGSLVQQSQNNYYATIVFYHQSGSSYTGSVYLTQDSSGNWKIYNIYCGGGLC